MYARDQRQLLRFLVTMYHFPSVMPHMHVP